MQKFLLILATVFFGVYIVGCGAGGTSSSPIISIAIESGSDCTSMTSGSLCSIVVNYNNNGTIEPTLGYTTDNEAPGISQNGTLESSIDACQNLIDTVSVGTCTISFTYSINYIPATNTNLYFTLDSTTSNGVYVQGN